jgi:hypothetical protein
MGDCRALLIEHGIEATVYRDIREHSIRHAPIVYYRNIHADDVVCAFLYHADFGGWECMRSGDFQQKIYLNDIMSIEECEKMAIEKGLEILEKRAA